jgi:uroporphyrinogen-III synthase
MPLQGRTIALAEGRQLEEFAAMLEKEGATVLRCPMVSILDQPDIGPVTAWLHELISGSFSYVVLLTGEGLRRLLGFAECNGLRDDFIAALAKIRTITRGPKPVRALKEIGLTPCKVAATPTTDGVIESLKQEPLTGLDVGVQLYSDTNQSLVDYIVSAGARVHSVLPYIYAPSSAAERIVDLIAKMASGSVDCVVFTSSPQVDRLVEVAAGQKMEHLLREGWNRVKIAAVGPVVKDKLIEIGARADIMPEQGFQMKNLVQHIKRAFAESR